MGLHVASEGASSCAREVTLWANKGLLSAVNQHVSFQRGRCVTRMAALVAIVTFLSNMIKLAHRDLAGDFEFFLLAYAVCNNAWG